jgi:hypothetical protein
LACENEIFFVVVRVIVNSSTNMPYFMFGVHT